MLEIFTPNPKYDMDDFLSKLLMSNLLKREDLCMHVKISKKYILRFDGNKSNLLVLYVTLFQQNTRRKRFIEEETIIVVIQSPKGTHSLCGDGEKKGLFIPLATAKKKCVRQQMASLQSTFSSRVCYTE